MCNVCWVHVVVGDDVDIDAAVSLEPDGDHHDEEVKNGVLAFTDNLPKSMNLCRITKW